jgi:hypothetical protein
VAHAMGVAHQSLQLYEALAKKDPVRAESKLHTAKEMTKTALERRDSGRPRAPLHKGTRGAPERYG